MFKNLTYKKKFYTVLVLLVLLSITSYKRSFKKTIETISFYTVASNKIVNHSENIKILKTLEAEMNQLNQIIGKRVKNPEIVQNQILHFLNDKQDDITISKIENVHISKDDYFNVYSNSITLQGDINSQLKAMYAFEKEFEYARIATADLYVIRNSKTAKKELYNNIIFQNYERKN